VLALLYGGQREQGIADLFPRGMLGVDIGELRVTLLRQEADDELPCAKVQLRLKEIP
jgi:hypothetical protein